MRSVGDPRTRRHHESHGQKEFLVVERASRFSNGFSSIPPDIFFITGKAILIPAEQVIGSHIKKPIDSAGILTNFKFEELAKALAFFRLIDIQK